MSQAGPEQNSNKECVFSVMCYTEGTQGLFNSTETFTMQSTHTAIRLKSQTRFLHKNTLLSKQLLAVIRRGLAFAFLKMQKKRKENGSSLFTHQLQLTVIILNESRIKNETKRN